MRDEILEFLRKKENEFVSGQEMSEACHVSRTAIWKHITALRAKGYCIESYTKKGYRLLREPDLVGPLEMDGLINTKYMGREYQYVTTTESTNALAREAAQAGAPEGTVVVAEEQKAGRGRLQRGWFSPKEKGLWFSVILRPHFLPVEAPKCTLLAAVALTKAFHELGLTSAGIKWPNDILVNGKKIVGILTEMAGTMEEIEYIIMGIGVNVTLGADDLPEDLKDIATSFYMEGVKVDRRQVFATILRCLEEQYEAVLKKGFEGTLAEWRDLSVTLNKDVEVRAPDHQYRGRAIDIDSDGNLLVENEAGVLERVVAGDVSIRPAKV